MRKVLLSSLFVVFIILLSSSVNAQYTQLQITDVTFIPRTVSAKSGVIVVAEVEGEGSIRVSWYSPTYFGGGYNVIGNLFKIDDGKYICYFSNTDQESMCGPSPFIEPNMGDYIGNPPTEFIVWAQSPLKEEQNEMTSKTEQVYVGSIKLNPVLTVEGGKLYMLVYPNNIVTSVKYEIYDKKINKLAEGELEWDPVKGGYTKGIPYSDNYYYVAFSALSSNDAGGNVVRIPRETENQTGISANLIIDDIVIHDAVVMKNMQTTFHRLFKITNLGNTLTNLRVDVPSALSSYLEIDLENTTLQTNDTIYMDVIIKNIAADTDIRTTANLMSGNEKVGEIKVNIEVSVIKGEVSTTLPRITPATWSDEYELGVVDKEFVISNNAGLDIYGINYTASGEIKNIISVETPKQLTAYSTEKIKMRLNPRSAGTKTGVVSINTNAGSIEIPISVTFYEKVLDKVSAAEQSLQELESKMTDDQKTKLSQVLTNIEDDIQSAKTYSTRGNYKEAVKEIEKAEAKIDILGKIIASGLGTGTIDTGQPNGYTVPDSGDEGSNLTLIIIISIIGVGAAVGAWYYFTKIRKSEEEWEEEIEEEF
jgi:hypothetical protein